ncbi:unnamed protein product [Heligmosomoides polygyrus]|uniref:SH3 domain-containing protein n=1 Tax=Heligmosomoides polygyrus TaxID=6339 RepID=A0A3P7WWI2_HELPZ|nr:unnamed protein product [Heligmosomoides polygyrus]
MSVTFPCWSRVSNAVEDPQTKTSVAQDQVIQLTGEDGDWYTMRTLDGVYGRVPKILTNPITNPLRTLSEKVFCSIAQYDAQRDGDLSFAIFTILVSDGISTDGYSTGVVVTDAGKRLGSAGTYPSSYVTELIGFVPPPDAPPAIPTSFTTNFTDVRFRDQHSGNSNYNVLPYARVVYQFNAEFANELSLNVDDIVTLTKRIDKDWLEGSINGKTGIFPQSFVQIVVDLPNDVHSDSENKRHSSAEEGVGFAIVRHDFIARQNDELTVKMGDSVRVLKMVNTDWVSCKDPATDASGIVPVAFLEVYLDEDEDDGRDGTSQHRPQSATEQTFSTLTNTSFTAPPVVPDWRTSTRVEDPAPPPGNYGFLYLSLVPMHVVNVEAGPQSHGWATFGDDWNVVEKKPPARPPPPKVTTTSPSEMISVTEMLGMAEKQNTPVITASNSNLNQDEKRSKVLEELINTELQFITDINAYTEKTDAKIETAFRELVVRMRASGAGVFDASTAVSRPVQRCVKYPLFLSEIAKYTAINHPDHPKLLEAVKQLSLLGSKMNESKRRKELTRKYTEEQSNTTLGDKLSKFTVHSIKKKTNRFTYRMGSSLGVVKVTRDADFDRLVCELDQAERRLVRFNYMLVIYRKKMFYETRQVRDEIVKALRAIPKKLIRKRNDKLLDYEAAKSSNKVKSDFMSKFKDFEALNNQVKQTLPKVIDVLNMVLRDAMKTVDELDANLISRIRSKFQEEIAAYQNDPLANSASKFVRLNSISFSPGKQKSEDWKAPSGDSTSTTAARTLADKKAFRAQTEEERSQILVKADLKLCYNGYYNALLPSTILTPWYGSGGTTGIELGIDALSLPSKTVPTINRPHSTPPKQQSTNLIDLDDDLLPSAGGQPICTLTPLAPVPIGAAASISISSINPEPPSIDWGAASRPGSQLPPAPARLQQSHPTTQSTSNGGQDPFTVMWEQIKNVPLSNITQRSESPQPIIPSRPAFDTLFPTTSAAAPPFMQVLNPEPFYGAVTSGSSTTAAGNAPASYSSAFYSMPPQYDVPPVLPSESGQTSAASAFPAMTAPAIPTSHASAMYSMPPQYDVVPDVHGKKHLLSLCYCSKDLAHYEVLPAGQLIDANLVSSKLAEIVFRSSSIVEGEVSFCNSVEPAVHRSGGGELETHQRHILLVGLGWVKAGTEASVRNDAIGKMLALYDFKPVGPNQIEIVAGERLDLIQAHDDGGNPEWIWVQRPNGQHGYPRSTAYDVVARCNASEESEEGSANPARKSENAYQEQWQS